MSNALPITQGLAGAAAQAQPQPQVNNLNMTTAHADDLASSGFVRMICKGLQDDSQVLLSRDFKPFIVCCLGLFSASNEILQWLHLFNRFR